MLLDAIGKSDFFSVFITGCSMFYIAGRLIRTDWTTAEANRMRKVIAYTFYAFGVIVLVVSLGRIPGCESQRNKPQIEQQQVPQAQPQRGENAKVPYHQK